MHINLRAENLREMLHYEPTTGVFTWREPSGNQVEVGERAGWVEKKGYRRICVNGKNYQAHRLAWLYMTGSFPSDQIDHKNLIKSDNSWANLRLANNSQNQANKPATKRNSSGYKGVYWHKRFRRWHASIMVNGVLKFLGYCDSKEDASALYAKAAKQHFGEFARIS